MPERGQLTGPQAAQRRRAWLDGRHRWHRDLVLVLRRKPGVRDLLGRAEAFHATVRVS